tara:strand:- start:992 stop:1195 length:204 start_codon:yes stop_codon:yes gene_type:complete
MLITNRKDRQKMNTISCPKCDYETEALIKDNGDIDKDYIPEHYCYPLSDNLTTTYYKINNKWIGEKE